MLIIDKDSPPIAEDEVHTAFLRREDIAELPAAEQEARWQEQKLAIDRFWGALHGATAAESIEDVASIVAADEDGAAN